MTEKNKHTPPIHVYGEHYKQKIAVKLSEIKKRGHCFRCEYTCDVLDENCDNICPKCGHPFEIMWIGTENYVTGSPEFAMFGERFIGT